MKMYNDAEDRKNHSFIKKPFKIIHHSMRKTSKNSPVLDEKDFMKFNFENSNARPKTELNSQAFTPFLNHLNLTSVFPFETKIEPESSDDQAYFFQVKQEQSESSPLTDITSSLKQEEEIQIKIKYESTPKAHNKQSRNYWLQSEDSKLLSLVQQHGKKWTKISTFMDGRNGKQVRDRYMNYLKPNIQQKEWTKEEDDILSKLYDEFGNKWSKIALYLVGRTENQIKNRFHAALRKQKRRLERRKQFLITELALQNLSQLEDQQQYNNNNVDELKIEDLKPACQLNPLKKVCTRYESNESEKRLFFTNTNLNINFQNLASEVYTRQIQYRNEIENRENMLLQSVLYHQMTQANINELNKELERRRLSFYAAFPSNS